jgi:hypothetical protein
VKYESGEGYLYERGNSASDVQLQFNAAAHELGHVLGLADRYFNAVYWLVNYRINREWRQVKLQDWIDAELEDMRDFANLVADENPGSDGLPYFARRVLLPMDIPLDTEYIPEDNLMTTSTAVLTTMQMNTIIAMGNLSNAVAQVREQPPSNWVAILGSYRRNGPNDNPPNDDIPYDDFGHKEQRKIHTAWEARPVSGGTGLVWADSTSLDDEEYRYPCFGPKSKGRAQDGCIVDGEVLARSMGRRKIFDRICKKWAYRIGEQNTHLKMCYTRRLIYSLLR